MRFCNAADQGESLVGWSRLSCAYTPGWHCGENETGQEPHNQTTVALLVRDVPRKLSELDPDERIARMLVPANDDERIIAARLLDFFGRTTPWHRGLWNPGLILTLRELLEASEAVSDQILNRKAPNVIKSTCLQLLAGEPENVRGSRMTALRSRLSKSLDYDGLEYHALRMLTDQVESAYLLHWADAFRTGDHGKSAERAARSIAAHLLDCGFSANYLHRWWQFRLRHEKTPKSLSEILEDAQLLARRSYQAFSVLICFSSRPRTRHRDPPEWLDPAAVSRWLRENSSDRSGLRPAGGISLTIEAPDPEAAGELAVERVDHLVARVAVSTGQETQLEPRVWVRGVKEPFPLTRHGRGVRVGALYREDQVFHDQAKFSVIDAVIDLLSHLERSSPSAAAAGGWAAIESLLSVPSDRGVAADRLAALVACSIPRAELTAIAYAVERSSKHNEALRRQLSLCVENRQRCSIVAKAILSGQLVEYPTASDLAASARVAKVLNSPRKVLGRVRAQVESAFRRLYRQRNLVLHWGRTDAVALRVSLRTAAPLVGAGMDRIAHGWYVDRLRPIELAGCADVALETVLDRDVDTCLLLLAVPHGNRSCPP